MKCICSDKNFFQYLGLGLLLLAQSSGWGATLPQTTRVVGWGFNNNGQANPPSGLTNVTALTAGSGQGVALRANGTVTSWGFAFQPGMPPGLSNIAAVECGRGHTLALRSNGTVVAWGENESGQASIPIGLSNIIAVSGGTTHSLALREDGTVVAWGTNTYGQLDVPPGLTNVIAVAAGGNLFTAYSVALKSDGTVMAWGNNQGGQTNVPPGLSNVVAIAASPFFHTLALKSDGTVAGWGVGGFTTNFPRNLSNVVAVRAGTDYSLALRADGSLVGWGDNTYGTTNVPTNARSNVYAIASGWFHNLAVTRSNPPPWPRLRQHPQSQRKLEGDMVEFTVLASAEANIRYRWQFKGRDIPGANQSSFILTNLVLAATGDYAVIVTADGLALRSAPAFLSVVPRPMALAQTLEFLEDKASLVTLSGTDPSALPLVAWVTSLPSAGSLYQFNGPLRGPRIDRVPMRVTAENSVVYISDTDASISSFDEFSFVMANDLGQSLPARVQINLLPVNDAPSFTKGPDLVVSEDAGPQTVVHWATDLSAGPPNERGQSLVFRVASDNDALFSSLPRIDETGTLTFRSAPDSFGTARVTVSLEDDGGTENGGTDQSESAQFTITVLPLNDPPVALGQTVTVLEDTAVSILLTAVDADGDALTWRVQAPRHGTVTGAPPQLLYRPGPDYFGSDSFTFTAFDGEVQSAPALVQIEVTPVNDAPLPRLVLSSVAPLTFTGSSNFVFLTLENSGGIFRADATATIDPEGDPLQFFWFLDFSIVPFASGIRVTNLVSPGPHQLLLLASDGKATAQTSVEFEAITPGDAVEALIDLVEEGGWPRNRKRALLASLKAAAASFDRGHSVPGLHQLETFQHRLRMSSAGNDADLVLRIHAGTEELLHGLLALL